MVRRGVKPPPSVLPLLMLVGAFAGHELTMRAYREAVEREYRFFLYGDAMVVL